MDQIKENFCKSLKAWNDKQPHGTVSKVAGKTGVTPGFLSNVISGRRAGTEAWRRAVAAVIGIPYNEMIGIDETTNPKFQETFKELEKENALLKKQLEEKTQALQYAYRGWNNSEDLIKLFKEQIRALGGSLAGEENSETQKSETDTDTSATTDKMRKTS